MFAGGGGGVQELNTHAHVKTKAHFFVVGFGIKW